jgi:hypothetical protein
LVVGTLLRTWRQGLYGHLDGLAAVLCFANDFNVLLLAQQRAKSLADDFVIVNE